MNPVHSIQLFKATLSPKNRLILRDVPFNNTAVWQIEYIPFRTRNTRSIMYTQIDKNFT
jgi:hypothetical protein